MKMDTEGATATPPSPIPSIIKANALDRLRRNQLVMAGTTGVHAARPEPTERTRKAT